MSGRSDPFLQLLGRAKNGSHLDIHNLIDLVPGKYAEHGQAILDTISAVLEVPQDVPGYKPTTEHLIKILCAWMALLEVGKWYQGGRTHRIPARALVDESFAKKYLFWALILLRVSPSMIPLSSPTSLPSPMGDLECGIYYIIPGFFGCLLMHPAISYRTFPGNLKPALLDVTIAWWVALLDGHPPFSPMGRDPDPDADDPDPSTCMFFKVVIEDTQGMSAAVLRGNICTPEVFVERTIARMRILSNINVIPHLSHFPALTIEVGNMGIVESITEVLMGNDRLRELFLEQGAPGAYINVFATLGKKLEVRSLAIGKPQNTKTQDASHIDVLVREATTVLKWVTSSPTAVLRHMNDVIRNGAVQLVRSAIVLRPDEKNGLLDEFFLQLTLYSTYLEPFPALCKDVDLLIAPHAVQTPNGAAPRTDRSVALGLDAAAVQMISQFIPQDNRVRLCDNLKHYDRVVGPEPKERAEKGCSRCHTVVYCSEECQKEDWKAFHKSECAHMAKEYADRHRQEVDYSYHDRAFHTSFMRYQYESRAFDHDKYGVPYKYGRDGVNLVDPFRPLASAVFPLDRFTHREYNAAPRHIMKRLQAFVDAFSSTNGAYRGDDLAQIRAQNARLVYKSFPLGLDDINVLVLLRRIAFDSAHADGVAGSLQFRLRGPQANSDYIVLGTLAYTTPKGLDGLETETWIWEPPCDAIRFRPSFDTPLTDATGARPRLSGVLGTGAASRSARSAGRWLE